MEVFRKIQEQNATAEVMLFKQILEEGIRCGEFKTITMKETTALAATAITMLRGIAANALMSGGLIVDDDQMNVAIDVFVRGILLTFNRP